MKEAPSLALVRVDNRLVHGQVLEAWVPALEARALVVADDESAGDALARSAMGLAIPSGVSLTVLGLAAAAERLRPGGAGAPAPRTLLLVRDVRDAAALRERGVPLPLLNLGNVHYAAGRRQLSASVFLDADELVLLDRLEAAGTRVEARAVPVERALSLAELHAHFAAAAP